MDVSWISVVIVPPNTTILSPLQTPTLTKPINPHALTHVKHTNGLLGLRPTG